nr:MAG TPA: hypothetical protein [Caudoviricetes sp.]
MLEYKSWRRFNCLKRKLLRYRGFRYRGFVIAFLPFLSVILRTHHQIYKESPYSSSFHKIIYYYTNN